MNLQERVDSLELSDAIIFATEAHRGQVNKHNGEPYILHPLEVMKGFSSPSLMIVAVLHDVVEDTEATSEDIWNGFGPKIGAAVDAITHNLNETNKEYWRRCAENDLAYTVKRRDVFCNLERNYMVEGKETRERLLKKYTDATKYLNEYRDLIMYNRSL